MGLTLIHRQVSGLPLWIAGFLVSTLLFAGVSRGQPAAPAGRDIGTEPSVAVIEVYVGDFVAPAAADYTRSIAFSMSSTGQYAVMARDEVGNRFRSVLITPVTRLQSERLSSIEQMVREGDQLVYTDPKAAVEVLGRARSQLESIAEGLAANQKLRREFLKTQMLLARSHLDTGNEIKAGAILREVIRVYGNKLKVTEDKYHPRLVKLYRRELRAMNSERRAVMSVATTDPGCKTLMDGRVLKGRTPREYRGLYPGVHHVQVQCGSNESMIRKVYLSKAKPVHLVVDVDFENSLTVEGGRLGLRFDSMEAMERLLVPYASKFGSLVNSDVVVAHGFLDHGTRAALKARLVTVKTGAVLKEASVPAKTDVVTPSSVRRLVQLLTGREEFEVAQPRTYPTGSTPWYKNYWGWTSTAIAVGGIVVGGVLLDYYFLHRSNATEAYSPAEWALISGGNPSPYEYRLSEASSAKDMEKGYIASFAVGGAALVAGIVLFVMTDEVFPAETGSAKARDDDGPRFVAAPQVTRHGGGFFGRLTF